MATSRKKVSGYIKEWEKAGRAELMARLKTLSKKAKTSDTLAEIKAVATLLS